MSAKNRLNHWLQTQWYGKPAPCALLLPLEALFRQVATLRRRAYQRGMKAAERLPVPVIVVGNLTVGGTGKTPLTIWLARFLREQGYQPGIVSRGYGGDPGPGPLAVTADSDPARAGDEPVLIARHTGCPVVVFPRRVEAARALLAAHPCDVLLADDGLQHYALARDLEIAVVDGTRGFGNGHCLPAGPLREPVERLDSVDLVVHSGVAPDGGWSMALEGATAVNLRDESLRKPLAAFAGPSLHAVAGIGHPERFFGHLRAFGLSFHAHAFPDHHRYRPGDLDFGDDLPVLMTEKDAVKCRCLDPLTPALPRNPASSSPSPQPLSPRGRGAFTPRSAARVPGNKSASVAGRYISPGEREKSGRTTAGLDIWYVPVEARLPEEFGAALLALLNGVAQNPHSAAKS